MRLIGNLLVIAAAAGALAVASGACAQTDRYAYGPSTPNSDGTEGYGSYSAMEGSSFVDTRRTVANHNDGLVYPLAATNRGNRGAPNYAYAPEAAPVSGDTRGEVERSYAVDRPSRDR